MKLRQRTILCVAGTLACLLAGVYFLSSRFLLRSYETLEARETTRNIERANDALSRQIDELAAMSKDWANWDDSFHFMENRNKGYIQANLSVVALKLDMIMFLDPKGRVFCSRGVDRTKGVKPPSAEALRKALGFDRPLSERPGKGSDFAGVVKMSPYPMIASVRPIVRTDGKGSGHGWLVFALYFDPSEISSLAARTHLQVGLFGLDRSKLPADGAQILPDLKHPRQYIPVPLDANQIAGYCLVNDVHGRPVQLLRIVEPRAIYQRGLGSVAYLMQLILIAGIVFSIVIILVVEISALSRVSKLSAQVERIGDEAGSLSRVYLAGGDELSWLAWKINAMLRALRDSRERLAANNESLAETVEELAATNRVLEHAVEGISRLDPHGCFASANSSFAKTLGYGTLDVPGMHWTTGVHPDDHCKFQRCLEDAHAKGKSEVEVRGVRRDGRTFDQEVLLIAATDEKGVRTGTHYFMKDISDRKRLETQIEHQAFHDSLTDLPNRVLFMERLTLAQARATRRQTAIAILFLDLDNFKTINDSLGHEAGDRMLMAVTQRLKDAVRPEDLIARFGGDEFTVLLEDLGDVQEALAVVERIKDALRAPIALPEGETFTGVSIGIAFSANGMDEPESLLRDADTAMYQAKAHGKAGYVVFEKTMNDRAVERMELETSLRVALEKNEFCLHYQPLIDLQTGKMLGFEALLRWERPGCGTLTPDGFLWLAEETGLIVSIGRWALLEACRQAKEWQDEFPSERGLTVSVNVSGTQLHRADIVKQVVSVLEETGLPPGLLQLEINESVLMSRIDRVLGTLKSLQALGVKLAIDAFGTGYSSIATLESLPIDTVKIDRSFVSRLGNEAQAASVVGAIIMLSRTMNLEITAMGLEDRGQLQDLQAMGCRTAQGMFFARPLPAEEFKHHLHAAFDVFGQRDPIEQAMEAPPDDADGQAAA